MQVPAGGRPRIQRVGLVAIGMLAGTVSCTPTAFLNNTASLGGTTPGGRGNIQVQFINNTPFRAIFTFGAYDPQNSSFSPDFGQFFVDPDPANRLEGNSSSAVITLTCARALSVGGDRLIQLIKDLGLEAEAEALEPGISFSDAPLDSDDADQPTAGRTTGVVTLQGVEFQCESLLVYTFELDSTQASGFRIDLQVILP